MEQDALEEEYKKITSARKPNGLFSHPLMEALSSGALSNQEKLRKFCDVRYNAASEFELLLERALELAMQNPEHGELAEALRRNLCDERGLNYDTNEPHDQGAHSAWRKDFLDAIDVQVTPERSTHFPLYHFKTNDDLPTLVGMLLAAEAVIPKEDSLMLKAMRKAFPGRFTTREAPESDTNEQIKVTRYLWDHVLHDTQRHLPELKAAIERNLSSPDDLRKVKEGMARFAIERSGLYDHIASEIELPVEQNRGGFILT